MVWQTKEYVNDHLVKPVMKRADSVVEIGNAVLANRYTSMAADTLDSALNVADKYVDKYLPDAADQALEGKSFLVISQIIYWRDIIFSSRHKYFIIFRKKG